MFPSQDLQHASLKSGCQLLKCGKEWSYARVTVVAANCSQRQMAVIEKEGRKEKEREEGRN